jgi:hypothetical protein
MDGPPFLLDHFSLRRESQSADTLVIRESNFIQCKYRRNRDHLHNGTGCQVKFGQTVIIISTLTGGNAPLSLCTESQGRNNSRSYHRFQRNSVAAITLKSENIRIDLNRSRKMIRRFQELLVLFDFDLAGFSFHMRESNEIFPRCLVSSNLRVQDASITGRVTRERTTRNSSCPEHHDLMSTTAPNDAIH